MDEKQGRVKYTKQEDRDMVNFWEEELQAKNPASHSPLGLELWQMYINKGRSKRSASNISSHFRKIIFAKNGLFELGIGRKRMLNIFRMWRMAIPEELLANLGIYCKCDIVINREGRLNYDKTLHNLKIAQMEEEDKTNVAKEVQPKNLQTDELGIEIEEFKGNIADLIDECSDSDDCVSVQHVSKSPTKKMRKQSVSPKKKNPLPLLIRDLEIPDDISIDENLEDLVNDLDVNIDLATMNQDGADTYDEITEFREIAIMSAFERLKRINSQVNDDLLPYFKELAKEITKKNLSQMGYLDCLATIADEFLQELSTVTSH